jgi:hypothetical protein
MLTPQYQQHAGILCEGPVSSHQAVWRSQTDRQCTMSIEDISRWGLQCERPDLRIFHVISWRLGSVPAGVKLMHVLLITNNALELKS